MKPDQPYPSNRSDTRVLSYKKMVYLDSEYAVKETDILWVFRLTPHPLPRWRNSRKAAVAIEDKSSTATWTADLLTTCDIYRAKTSFVEKVPNSVNAFFACIAYECDLFKESSIVTSIFGKVFRVKAIKCLQF